MNNINFYLGLKRLFICFSALYAFAFFLFFYHEARATWDFCGSFRAAGGLNHCYEIAVHSPYFPKILYDWVIQLLQIISKVVPLVSAPNLFCVAILYSAGIFAALSLLLCSLLRTSKLALLWIIHGFKKSNSVELKST